MASYTVVYAAHKTLSTTVVDTITIARHVNSIDIINRSGGNPLYVTWAPGTTVPADPVAGAVDVDVIPTGMILSLDVPTGPVVVRPG